MTILVVFVAHSLALPASCPLISDSLSFTSKLANLTLPVNVTSLVNTTKLSAVSTASDLYEPGEIRTEICNFGSFSFGTSDVDKAINAAILDISHHVGNESMPRVAYYVGQGGGLGVVLKLEPIQGAVSLTWGMWRSALMDITNYYEREGKVPIEFNILYITESTALEVRALLIGGGSLMHDFWGDEDEG